MKRVILDEGVTHALLPVLEEHAFLTETAHLLIDVPDSRVDAAIVISNDGDLKLPIRAAHRRVPVGIVNPSPSQLAGDLRGIPDEGVGGHWWYKLMAADFRACQLPGTVGSYGRRSGW